MDSHSNIVKSEDTKPTPPELNEQRAGKPKTKPKSPSKTKTSPSKHSPVKTSITGASAGGGSYKPSHPEITMRLVEIALNGLTPEQRVQVAAAYGIVLNLLHMSWANVQKKKILKIVRDGL